MLYSLNFFRPIVLAALFFTFALPVYAAKPCKTSLAIREFVRANAGNDPEDHQFPPLCSGNCGLHAYLVDKADEPLILDVIETITGYEIPISYNDRLFAVLNTEDESTFSLWLYSTGAETFRPTGIKDMNVFGFEEDLRPAFKRFKITLAEYANGFEILWHMFKNAKEIKLGTAKEGIKTGWSLKRDYKPEE